MFGYRIKFNNNKKSLIKTYKNELDQGNLFSKIKDINYEYLKMFCTERRFLKFYTTRILDVDSQNLNKLYIDDNKQVYFKRKVQLGWI